MGSVEPYARLSLRDRLELLAFEAGLAGFPESLIQELWEESTARAVQFPAGDGA